MDSKQTILQRGGGWATNIGNAFIDLGSMFALESATENTNVHLNSTYGRWVSTQMKRGVQDFIKGNLGSVENVFTLSKFAKADYVVQSGAILSEHWFDLQGDALVDVSERGANIILHGVGMTDGTYTESEIERTREWIEKIDPYAFISRDERAFESFAHIAEHSYNGIDCGFFVNETFDPIELDISDYAVVNFDKREEPSSAMLGIESETPTIRTHHSFWLDFSISELKKMRKEYYYRDDVLISDIPDDYLHVYAGSNGTCSDRVHACVGTMAYGNPAHLIHETPRSLLFERVGLGDITEGLTEPDLDRLTKEKEAQVEFLSEIL